MLLLLIIIIIIIFQQYLFVCYIKNAAINRALK